MRQFTVLSVLCMTALVRAAVDYPVPVGLTHSNWPIAHGSTWNSDVSGLPGPSKAAKSVQLLINGDNITDIETILLSADSITLAYSSIDGYVWGSGVSGVYQLKISANEVSVINTLFRDVNFEYHGAYSLLAADGTYFAAAKTSIQGYQNTILNDFSTPIIRAKEYFVPNLDDGEHIVGLTMTFAASLQGTFLVYATTQGQVGAVSLDFSRVSKNIYRIEGLQSVALPDHFVSNSIAMDGPQGGVYVCTSASMNRLQWDADTLTINNSWQTLYGDGQDEWYWGRLGPGCGTSPTILGPNKDDQGQPVAEYVVIGDGENPMNIRFYDVLTGAQAASHVVTFAGATAGNSTTDQSIVVQGYRAVVVNNYVESAVTTFCSTYFDNTSASDALKHECPYLFGAYVNGVEQFQIDPATGTVTSVWANPNVSCTSVVPTMSAANDVFYCLGKRPAPHVTDAAEAVSKRDQYTIEALSWSTGQSLYHVNLGSTLLSNGLYAGTIIGTQGDIVMGTLSGILRLYEDTTTSSASATATTVPAVPTVPAVWTAMDRLAQWNADGHVPTVQDLQQLQRDTGVALPGFLLPKY